MRKRADLLLVERGFFASRARAQAAIAAGLVSADGALVRKSSDPIAPDAKIEAAPAHPWASRGGIKLAAALDAFGLDPAGLACLDVGASTGGFTDVLLTRGAAAVVAVDVGHGQFDPRLADGPARHAARGPRRARADARRSSARRRRSSAMSASFRSGWCCRIILPLAAKPAWLVSLIKPQFEVGRDRLVKGAVKDPAALARGLR